MVDRFFSGQGDHDTHIWVAGIMLLLLGFLVAVRKGMTPSTVM